MSELYPVSQADIKMEGGRGPRLGISRQWRQMGWGSKEMVW